MADGSKHENLRIGIDLGGTKIAAVALGPDGKEVGAHKRVPTPKDYDAIIQALTSLVKELEKEAGGQASVGICTPGAVDAAAGVIRFSPNIMALTGRTLGADLKKALSRDVRMANDAACFALSEAMDGAAKDMRVVYGVILGTGVGGALVTDKKISSGPNGVMEWGHLPFPWPESDDVPERCGCGRMGDIESYLSGPALYRQLSKATGRTFAEKDLHQALLNKDGIVFGVVDRYLTRLAKAFALLITIMDPDALVLGGGLSNLDIIYEQVPARLGKYTIVPDVRTKILKAKYGDDSGLRGAAWL
jgi:fructokinase